MSLPREKLKSLPPKPGVYLFKDKEGVVIYVGKANSLRRRVSSYFNREVDLKTSLLLAKLHDIEYILAASEVDALMLENDLIKQYQPRYNLVLKDDKNYPYLKLTVNEEWPRLFVTRRKINDGALYFGRFQGSMVKEIIKVVKHLFPIRWCAETPHKMREQACLYYRIGACAGSCVGETGIDRRAYQSLVLGIKALLEGKMDKALKQLKREMVKASADQDYERAAFFRDKIKALETMVAGKELHRFPAPRGISELEDLKGALHLDKLPMRIEAFDISNIQGTNVVGSMVTFLGGVPLKNAYRKFKVHLTEGEPNDVVSMREVVARRYNGMLAHKLPLPDLILIDGGLPQVNFAAQASPKGIPIIGLAKKEEEIFSPGQNRPLKLRKSSSALKLLQRLRDEAHRFAVAYHRRRRTGNLFA